MNESMRRTIADLTQTAAVVAIIGYACRREIREAIDRRRVEIEAKRAEIEARVERERKGRAYLGAIRETIIAEELEAGPYYGMEP